MAPSRRRDFSALWITAIYTLISATWIAFSDRLAASLMGTSPNFTAINTIKGWFFVLVTGLLLYSLIEQNNRRLRQSEQLLRQTNQSLTLEVDERRQIEKSLRQSEEHFRLIVEHLRSVFWISNPREACLLYVSPTYEAIWGRSIADLYANFDEWIQAIHPEDQERVQQAFLTQVLEGTYNEEYRVIQPDGKVIWVRDRGFPIILEPARECRVVGIAEDITHSKQAEEALRLSEERFRVVLNNSPVTVFNQDRELRYTWIYNPKVGLDQAAIVGLTDFDLFPNSEDNQQLITVKQQVLDTGVGTRQEVSVSLSPQEGSHIFDLRIEPLHDRGGEVIGITCVAFDISDRKQIEAHLTAALAEKEVLLKEIHHRVKNNLQVISSLLHLQAQTLQDPSLKEIFRECQNRVESMSLIHKTLYNSMNLGQINLADYIRNLASHLLASYQIRPSQIQLQTELQGIGLNLDQAIPCGLIINELVSNALKYAFPDGRSGEIGIRLQAMQLENWVELVIWDDGIGLPANTDWQSAQTLGLSLVRDLVLQQLEGQILHTSQQGTCFQIQFPRHG